FHGLVLWVDSTCAASACHVDPAGEAERSYTRGGGEQPQQAAPLPRERERGDRHAELGPEHAVEEKLAALAVPVGFYAAAADAHFVKLRRALIEVRLAAQAAGVVRQCRKPEASRMPVDRLLGVAGGERRAQEAQRLTVALDNGRRGLGRLIEGIGVVLGVAN